MILILCGNAVCKIYRTSKLIGRYTYDLSPTAIKKNPIISTVLPWVVSIHPSLPQLEEWAVQHCFTILTCVHYAKQCLLIHNRITYIITPMPYRTGWVVQPSFVYSSPLVICTICNAVCVTHTKVQFICNKDMQRHSAYSKHQIINVQVNGGNKLFHFKSVFVFLLRSMKRNLTEEAVDALTLISRHDRCSGLMTTRMGRCHEARWTELAELYSVHVELGGKNLE